MSITEQLSNLGSNLSFASGSQSRFRSNEEDSVDVASSICCDVALEEKEDVHSFIGTTTDLLRDGDRIGNDFGQRFDDVVELRSTESYTLRIQYRIRSAGKRESTSFRIDFDPLQRRFDQPGTGARGERTDVSLSPDGSRRELLEIRSMIFSFVVVPEFERKVGERFRDDLPHRTYQRSSRLVVETRNVPYFLDRPEPTLLYRSSPRSSYPRTVLGSRHSTPVA